MKLICKCGNIIEDTLGLPQNKEGNHCCPKCGSPYFEKVIYEEAEEK